MIEIRSKVSGEFLDLAPDYEFEIEMSNPIFESDHIPVPFSTAIGFLPTKRNKSEFGYLEAMLLEPEVKNLDVEIYASGIKILDGELIFDSIEDGIINYSFAGKNVADDWSCKIWEKSIYFISGNQLNDDISAIASGDVPGIALPLVFNANEASSYGSDATIEGDVNIVPLNTKLHNAWKDTHSYDQAVFTPAITLALILKEELETIDVPFPEILEYFERVAVLGQNKTDCDYTDTTIPAEGLELARTLPDVTAIDLLSQVAKIFCSAIFRDGERYIFIPILYVLKESDILNWDDKVSDKASLSSEQASSYKFAFGNDIDEVSYDAGAIDEISKFEEIFTASNADGAFRNYRHVATGDVYSVKGITINIPLPPGTVPPSGGHGHENVRRLFVTDIIMHDLRNCELDPTDKGDGSFDASVEAQLVSCVPVDADSAPLRSRSLAVKIVPCSIGEERTSDIYLGVIPDLDNPREMVDKGVSFWSPLPQNEGNRRTYGDDAPEAVDDIETLSLAPDYLYDALHSEFADWLRTRRQTVTAELNLTMADVAALRMYQRVSFRGRLWVFKSVNLVFRAGSDKVDATGTFVSVVPSEGSSSNS